MPNWAGSSWYFLRYTDPANEKALASKEALSRWTPIDWYNGGMEHTTLHLLYSRFWHKFLFDIGVVPTAEPYKKRTSHGLILAEGGVKMSKSKGNVVNPDSVIDAYGADTLRVYEMFMGPFDQPVAWSTESIIGSRRFLERLWKLSTHVVDGPEESDPSFAQAVDKVSGDIEGMRFNTAISALMILLGELEKRGKVVRSTYHGLLKLVSPFAPHITEELWATTKGVGSVHEAPWPAVDTRLLSHATVTIGVQVNGKLRDTIEVDPDATEDAVIARTLALETIIRWLDGRSPKKTIYIKGKIVSIVV
jgi:leucyl-tRNA synthetase